MSAPKWYDDSIGNPISEIMNVRYENGETQGVRLERVGNVIKMITYKEVKPVNTEFIYKKGGIEIQNTMFSAYVGREPSSDDFLEESPTDSKRFS